MNFEVFAPAITPLPGAAFILPATLPAPPVASCPPIMVAAQLGTFTMHIQPAIQMMAVNQADASTCASISFDAIPAPDTAETDTDAAHTLADAIHHWTSAITTLQKLTCMYCVMKFVRLFRQIPKILRHTVKGKLNARRHRKILYTTIYAAQRKV